MSTGTDTGSTSPRISVSNALAWVLRGVSQIFFVRNAWSGLVILLAMAWVHPWFAGMVLLGAVVQTVGAWVLGEQESAPEGLMGYNGALVGAAAAFDLGGTRSAVLMTLVGALACIPVHRILQRLFESRAMGWSGLPVSTAPFCIVAGLLFGVVSPLVVTNIPTTASSPVQAEFLGIFNDFSEVVLGDGLLPGILILAALLLGSWRIGLFGLFGSVVGSLGAWIIYRDAVHVSSGILGYSAVLVAIAVGAVFWAEKSWWLRVLGATIGVGLTLALQPLLTLTPIPVYTWPFLLSLWIVLAAGAALRKAALGKRA